MAKINVNPIRPQDLEHELPRAEQDGFEEREDAPAAPPSAKNELEKIKAERDSLFDRLARLQAEFENYRKRAQREQGEFRDYALADAVRSLLPVLDSLDLALKNSAGENSELHSGVELTRKQFADALAKLGLREVPAQGEMFSPQWHQAVEMVPSEDVPDHQIIEELQRGYKLKDRLLRPAMVRVASNPNSKH
jgi:molecular chaperone GrpE